MNELRKQLAEMGINLDSVNDEAVRKVAKSMGLKLPPKQVEAHKVEVIDYTPKGTGKSHKYIRTNGFVREDGFPKGIFVRVDCAVEALQDLKTGLKMLGVDVDNL